ncbi:MAG: prepilin-type N-terminal cleavage/methylation domain-containing protein [Gammaproteobacteria bacterium]|nr:prepilin-type N-terminal cleavage/methylation domain-containing protein [Gammaproteobacteria bacterium]
MISNRHRQTRLTQRGLTLIELLITLVISAIVITMVTPVSNLLKRNQTTANLHEFISALNFARSEAITRGANITICRADTANPAACAPLVTDPIPIPWEQGWIVFTDTNANSTADADEILRQHGPLSAGYTLRVTGRNMITYDRIGLTRNSNATWRLCDPTQEVQFKRGVQLILSGKVNLVNQADLPALPC